MNDAGKRPENGGANWSADSDLILYLTDSKRCLRIIRAALSLLGHPHFWHVSGGTSDTSHRGAYTNSCMGDSAAFTTEVNRGPKTFFNCSK